MERRETRKRKHTMERGNYKRLEWVVKEKMDKKETMIKSRNIQEGKEEKKMELKKKGEMRKSYTYMKE